MEDINATRRLVSEYRSQCKRLKVELNDWKAKYNKDTRKLQTQLDHEKKQKIKVYEEKIDRTSRLMHEMSVKDQKLTDQTRQLSALKQSAVEMSDRSVNSRMGTF